MLRNIFRTICVLLVTTLVSCSQTPSGYKIIGEIEGLSDGTVMELIPSGTHSNEKSIATATVAEGKFIFEGVLDEPRFFRVAVSGDNSYQAFSLMVENAKIYVNGKAAVRENNGAKSHLFSDITITGSSVHDLYLQKTAPKEVLNKLYEDYHTNNKDIQEKVVAARGAKDQKLLAELYKTEEWKKLEQDEKNFFDTVSKTMSQMILDNADSWWGPFLMLNQMSYFTKEQETWWNQLSD